MKQITKNALLVGGLMLFSNALQADGLTLKSTDLYGQITKQQVFNGFGCKGDNISPQLSWSNAPKGTKSFAVTMYDPDAPTGSGWWHWVVFNLPKDTNHISTGSSTTGKLPKSAVQSKTDFGKSEFGGACPAVGDKAHTYVTTVYALDVAKLDLDKNANPAYVGYMVNAHTIDKSSIVTYYKR